MFLLIKYIKRYIECALVPKKGLWDRIESRDFTLNLIGILSAFFLGIILVVLIIINRKDLTNVYPLLYTLAGFVMGLFGRKVLPNATD